MGMTSTSIRAKKGERKTEQEMTHPLREGKGATFVTTLEIKMKRHQLISFTSIVSAVKKSWDQL
jgi:hypothetical protein